MPNEAHLHWHQGFRFTAQTGSGFSVELDSPSSAEPQAAPSPVEMQLVALGGCTAMDVTSILRKMRQEVASYDLDLAGERAEGHPRVYTSVLMTHQLRGRDIVEANVRRAIQLSMDRYCHVFAMLYPRVDIRERFEIADDATGEIVRGDVIRSAAERPGNAAG